MKCKWPFPWFTATKCLFLNKLVLLFTVPNWAHNYSEDPIKKYTNDIYPLCDVIFCDDSVSLAVIALSIKKGYKNVNVFLCFIHKGFCTTAKVNITDPWIRWRNWTEAFQIYTNIYTQLYTLVFVCVCLSIFGSICSVCFPMLHEEAQCCGLCNGLFKVCLQLPMYLQHFVELASGHITDKISYTVFGGTICSRCCFQYQD